MNSCQYDRMDQDNDLFEEDDDREHLQDVVASFKHYRTYTLARINQRCRYISSLSDAHQRRLATYSQYLSKFRACVEVNESLIELVVRNAENIFLDEPLSQRRRRADRHRMPLEANFDTATHLQLDNTIQSVLRQFVRDWSKEGAEEREQCFKPMIDEIRAQFPLEKCEPGAVTVLVPGAGLGRLAWEIARLGYVCQGNDVSMHMLLAGNFILNHAKKSESYSLCPWLNDFNNNMSCEAQLSVVRVPDVCPRDVPLDNFTIATGDFLEVYKRPQWSCVATCFFIDCAQNVIEFVENIHRILRPGGVWINLGPLLYHWSDMPEKDSIEPPFDILLDIIKDIGFVVEKLSKNVKTKYAQNPTSMLQREYNSVFFVCRKLYDNSH